MVNSENKGSGVGISSTFASEHVGVQNLRFTGIE